MLNLSGFFTSFHSLGQHVSEAGEDGRRTNSGGHNPGAEWSVVPVLPPALSLPFASTLYSCPVHHACPLGKSPGHSFRTLFSDPGSLWSIVFLSISTSPSLRVPGVLCCLPLCISLSWRDGLHKVALRS